MIPAANGTGSQGTDGRHGPPDALRPDANWQATLSTLPPAPDARADSQQGCDDQVRGVEPDVGDHSLVGRTRRRRHREVTLLPARPADRARQARAFVASADLDDDQPRHLGRLSARHAVVLAAASAARLDPLGRSTGHFGRSGPVVCAAAREFPGPLSAGRCDRRNRAADAG